MMPAAKHFDPILGVDIHIIQPPGPVPPVPVPHPFVGFLIDPFDYAPIIGSTVLINSMHRALAGTAGKCLPPHIPIGGVFIKPPANECEMFMGSATVCIDGDAQSYAALPAISCHDVGMIPPPRINPKKKSKVKSMVLPTSVVLPIPAGPPVLIGGPPTISLMALGMRVGMAALGKAFKKLAKTKRFKKIKNKVKSKFKKKRKPSHHKSCGRPGEPVDVWSGANVDDFLDYELAGPIPFQWKRFYDSSLADQDGPLGRGFRHFYQRELHLTSLGFELVTEEGEVVEFEQLDGETGQTAADGFLLSLGRDGIYRIAAAGQPTAEFRHEPGKSCLPLAALVERSHRVELQYDSLNRLSSIRHSLGESIRFRLDATNHIREVSLSVEGQTPRTLARYEYDQRGHLLTWTDALGNSSYYAYDAAGRMNQKTDRNGYTYRYRYDELGRCVHTWGEDGLYDVRLEFLPEALLTIATYADGAQFTYVFDEAGTLVEILDAAGGSTKFVTDDDGNVVSEIDPAGNETKFLYDAWGGHTCRISPTGYTFPPMHVQPQQPDELAYELPRTPVEWEFGMLLERATYDQPGDESLRREFDLAEVELLPELSGQLIRPREQTDAMGRVVERVDGHGAREQWRYDRNGNLVAYHDPDDSIYARRIASWNLIQQTIDPLGNAASFDYSLREQVTRVTDAGGTISEFAYDGCDRLLSVVRHGQLRERYEYDAGGNLIRKFDANEQHLFELKPGPSGLPLECRLTSGEQQKFAYDPGGRLQKASWPGGEIALRYDWTGRVAGDLRNQRGVCHEVTPSDTRVTTWFEHYRATQRWTADGEFSIEDPTGAVHRFRLSRQGSVARHLSNGTRELAEYDAAGRCRLKLASSSRRAGAWLRQYVYSAGGDLVAVGDNQRGIIRFGYDAAHRLIQQVLPDGGVNHFTYDAANNLLAQPGLERTTWLAGNRLERANDCEFAYNHRNHVAARRGADEAVSYEYDELDRLVRVQRGSWSWRAEYDPLGRRVRKEWEDHAVEFFWDDDRLAAEIHDGKRLRIYVYANIASWVPFLFIEYDSLDADPASGRRFFVFTNSSGFPERVEDDQGHAVWQATVSPYGAVQVEPGATIELALRFPGHYEDTELGLFYNRFRYYDPQLGRYIQSDPLGIAGGLNVYAYPANPLTNVDLQGLHGKAHSKGQGNRKGGPRSESTSMRNGAAPKPNPKKLAGMTDEAFAATGRIAAKNNAKIRMRPSNPDCLDWIKKGNPKKPEFIKNKTINEVDELMGPPPAPGTKGLVGHFEPPPRNVAIKRAEQKLGRPLTDAEKAALEQRRAERLTEFHRNDAEIRYEKGEKVVVDDSKGVLVDNRAESPTQGEAFTGDHDMFDIQQKGPDGEYHPADPATRDKVVNDMKNDPNVEAQHGDHRSWEYDPDDKQARDIDQAVLKGHEEGGKPLVDFNPDGSVGTSHFEG